MYLQRSRLLVMVRVWQELNPHTSKRCADFVLQATFLLPLRLSGLSPLWLFLFLKQHIFPIADHIHAGILCLSLSGRCISVWNHCFPNQRDCCLPNKYEQGARQHSGSLFFHRAQARNT